MVGKSMAQLDLMLRPCMLLLLDAIEDHAGCYSEFVVAPMSPDELGDLRIKRLRAAQHFILMAHSLRTAQGRVGRHVLGGHGLVCCFLPSKGCAGLNVAG